MFGFYPLDIFLALLAVYLVIRGVSRGFAAEVVSLAGFFCSFFFSFKYSSVLGKILQKNAGLNGSLAQVLAVLILWLVIVLLAALLRIALKRALSITCLSGLDTLLGLFSAFVKFTLVAYSLIIAGFILTPIVNPTWMTDSDILRYAGRHWPFVRQIVIDTKLLANAEKLPNGTLEQILRPYRTGTKGPR